MIDGRWMGKEYVWSCPGCGCAMCASQAPDDEQARCLRCREVRDARARLASIRYEQADMVDAWISRALHAELEVERLKAKVARLEDDERRRLDIWKEAVNG